MQGFWNIWKRDDHNAGEATVIINFHEHLFARMAAKDSFFINEIFTLLSQSMKMFAGLYSLGDSAPQTSPSSRPLEYI
jgi:hypothetical protein